MKFKNNSLECLLEVFHTEIAKAWFLPQVREEDKWRFQAYVLEQFYWDQWKEHLPPVGDYGKIKSPHGGLKKVFEAAGIPAKYYPYAS